MAISLWSATTSRKIIGRLVVEGHLVLQTPAHLGSGDGDDLTDMPLLLDSLEGKPLLTGSTLAGALRSYLRSRECGSLQPLPDRGQWQQARESATVKLFGGLKGDDEGEQSSLIVDDAIGIGGGIEVRSGVRLNPKSRTAAHQALFDLQLWQAGTRFPIRLELLIRESDDESALRRALATALQGFHDGSITLGARKQRGYGRVTVKNWRVNNYDLTTAKGLINWIENGNKLLETIGIAPTTDFIAALGVDQPLGDMCSVFSIKATFALDGSLLIRSGGGKDDLGPDMVHLHARQTHGTHDPIVSGTSLGGALRARALKITQTIGEENKAHTLIQSVFGSEVRPSAESRSSRVIVEERVVKHAKTDLVQHRVSIDRFTGGALEAALFNEQPAFGVDGTILTTDVRLINPQDYEMGLLLLLLKDLWTGDLPVGVESSVGRGRLRGKSATIMYRNGSTLQTWGISANGEGLNITGDKDALEGYVAKLNAHVGSATA